MMKTSRVTLCITFPWTTFKGRFIHHNYKVRHEHAAKLHAMPDLPMSFHNKFKKYQKNFFSGGTSPLQRRDHVASD